MPIDPSYNLNPSIDGAYSEAIYAFLASGGFTIERGFAKINIYNTLDPYVDVTGSIQVMMGVDLFNTKLGSYNPVTDSYDTDSVTISASDFINGIKKGAQIISTGAYSTLYSDFTSYVKTYFGIDGGFSSLFAGASEFAIDGSNNFTNESFIRLLNGETMDASGQYISDLSGSITISGIRELLLWALDSNAMGNRDPAVKNWGLGDGFVEGDLIWIPEGTKITLNLDIESEKYNPVNNIGPDNADTLRQTTTFVNGNFASTTDSTTTNITRTVKAPLLIKLVSYSTIASLPPVGGIDISGVTPGSNPVITAGIDSNVTNTNYMPPPPPEPILPVTLSNFIILGTGSSASTSYVTSPSATWSYNGNTTTLLSAASSGSYYYAVGKGGNTTVIKSLDGGVTWRLALKSPYSVAANDVLLLNRTLVTCGSGGNTLAYVLDICAGNTWTTVNTGLTSGTQLLYDVSATRLFVVGAGSNTISFASSPASTWSGLGKYVFNEATTIYGPATYTTPKTWVAVGQGGTSLAYGTSASNIATNITSPLTSAAAVACGADTNGTPVWVAGGQGAHTLAFSKNPSAGWTGLGATVLSTNCKGVAYGVDATGSHVWMAVGSGTSHAMAFSRNPVTSAGWTGLGKTIFTSGYGVACGKDASGNALWMAAGTGTAHTLAYSRNPTVAGSWTGLGKTIFSTVGFSVAYGTDCSGDPIWVAAGQDDLGNNNALAYSRDPTNAASWVGLGSYALSVGQSVAFGTDGSGSPIWLASGSGISPVAYSRTPTVASSWTSITTGYPSSAGYSVSYGTDASGQAVWMVGQMTTNTIIYSNYPTVAGSWVKPTASMFSIVGTGFAQERLSKYIAGGVGINNMAGSFDGQTWYPIKSPFTVATHDVYWSKEQQLWVAVGEGTHTLAHSTNGIEWEGHGISVFSVRGKKVTYSAAEGKWYATGEGTYAAASSPDGHIWTPTGTTTPIPVPIDTNVMVLLSSALSGVSLTNVGTSFTAPVGSTMSTEDNMTPSINAIAYDGASTYYAGGTGTTNLIQSTDGGTSWYSVPSPFTASVTDIIYAGNALVAAGTGTNTLAYNLGSGWAPISTGQTSVSHLFYDTTSKLTYSCGSGANTISYSGNISGSWTGLGSYLFSNSTNTIYGPNQTGVRRWVAGGTGGNTLAFNGNIKALPWTGNTSSIFSAQTYGADFGLDVSGSTLWVAVGNGVGNSIAYSFNPTTASSWKGIGRTIFTSYGKSIKYGTDCCGNPLWIAGGMGGNTLAYSYNPTVASFWRPITTTLTSIVNSIGYGKDGSGNPLWMAGGSGTNRVVYSYNPTLSSSWTPLTNALITDFVNCIKYGTDCSGSAMWAIGLNDGSLIYSYTPNVNASWKKADVGYNGLSLFNSMIALEYGTDCSGNPLWVAGGSGTTHRMIYSRNPTVASSWVGLGNTFASVCGSLTYGTDALGAPIWAATGQSTLSNNMLYSSNPTVAASWTRITGTFSTASTFAVQERIPKYIAGGTGIDNMQGSIDGLTWFNIKSPFSIATNDVLYVSDYATWVAVGEGLNTFAYSYDGFVWYGYGTSVFDLYGKSITYNSQNMMLYATGYSLNGGLTTKSCQIINLSQWNNLGQTYPGFVPLSISNFNMYGSIFDPSAAFTFDKYNSAITTFAVDNNTSTMYAGGPAQLKVASSVDGGITWTGIMTPFSTSVNNLTVAGNQLVAAGSGGTSVALYDGTNWSSANTGLTVGNNLFYDASWSRIYAVGTGANTYAYSSVPTTASSWKGLGTYVNSNGINTMSGPSNPVNGRIWVAGGQGGNSLAYRGNIESGTWSANTISVFSTSVSKIKHGADKNGNSLWMAIGTGTTNTIAYSTNPSDKTSWVGLGKTLFSTTATGIDYGSDQSGNSLWIIAGNGPNKFAYSYDPTNISSWVPLNPNTFASYAQTIAYGKDSDGSPIWLAGGSGTYMVAYSKTPTIASSWLEIPSASLFLAPCGTLKYGTDCSGNHMWIAGTATTTANTFAYSKTPTIANSWVGMGNTLFSTCVQGIEFGTDGSGVPLWIISGQGTTNTMAFSYNPTVSWTGLGKTTFSTSCIGLTYGVNASGNAIWAAAGQGTSTNAYSYNPTSAANWTMLPNTFTSWSNTMVQEQIPKYIVGGNGVNNMSGSIDGQTWFYIKSPFTIATNDVFYSSQQSRWVAVGEGGNTLAYSNNGITWTGISLFSVRGKKVSFDISTNKWYAIGEGVSTMARSDDGMFWTNYSIPDIMLIGSSSTSKSFMKSKNDISFTYTWVGQNLFTVGRSIAYNGASTYYAVGDGASTMQTSTDNGNTWSSVTSPFTTSGRDIIYAGSQLVACGSGTNTMAYYNGTIWTPVDTGLTTGLRLYYEPNIPRIYALGQGANTMSFASSVSGTWTGLTNYVYKNGVNAMHGPAIYTTLRKLISVGSYSSNYVQYSTNITTNTALTVPLITYGWCITHGMDGSYNPLWVIGGIGGLILSYNGLNYFQPANQPDVGGRVLCCKFGTDDLGNNLWVAGGLYGRLWYSTNGYNWFQSTGVSPGGEVDSLDFGYDSSGNPLWIACASGSPNPPTNALLYSRDGKTWTGLGSTVLIRGRGVAYGFDSSGIPMWVAGGSRFTGGTGSYPFVPLAYSYDGINWTYSTTTVFADSPPNIFNIIFSTYNGKGFWMATSSKSTTHIAYSYDGRNWTSIGAMDGNSGAPNSLYYGIDNSGNAFWITQKGNSARRTYNPTTAVNTWSAISVNTTNGYATEIYPKYIVGGTGVNSMKGSFDGLTWYYIQSPFTSATNDVYWSQSQQIWVAVGEGTNTIAYSTDGLKWIGFGTSIFSVRGNKISFSATQNMWFVSGEGTNTLAMSHNGKAWLPITSTAGYVDISGIGLYVK